MSKVSFIEFPFSPSVESIICAVSRKPGAFFLDGDCRGNPPWLPNRGQAQGPAPTDSRYSYIGLFCEKIISDFLPHENFLDFRKKPFDFCGGWVGFLTFEGEGWWAYHKDILVLDHLEKKYFLVSCVSTEAELQKKIPEWKSLFLENPVEKINRDFLFDVQKPGYNQYKNSFEAIQKYLRDGDVYQVNLTCPFYSQTGFSSSTLYSFLRNRTPASYSAYLNAGEFEVMSLSPELFIKFSKEKVVTKPIKGTKARVEDPAEDKKAALSLLESAKDKAELLMIIDLERNDLGKICETGTVIADPLYSVETFSHVHHLVSVISGVPKKTVSVCDSIRALFPGGSVTGAPKKRALEIIHELEKTPRGVYTGALGFIDSSGSATLNLTIRTLTKEKNKLTFNAGGGVTIDSLCENEFEEMILKAKSILPF